jgi:hypothetical protein
MIALSLTTRQRSSATCRLRQMRGWVGHGAIMIREGDGVEEALSSREQELRLLVETFRRWCGELGKPQAPCSSSSSAAAPAESLWHRWAI